MQDFKPSDTIGNRYKVLRKLGAGAMGSVYLCEDSVENNIKVALKILISDGLDDQDLWAKGEYEALTRLRHPNLAKVYNFGRLSGSREYYIVSEFIKGTDLYSATEYLRYDELTDIIVQICRALEYIHSQGYVHFDIKPDNILVTRYKTIGIKEGSKVQYEEAPGMSSSASMCSKPIVKLIDFGLAEKITGSFNFAIKGTLNYLAPEILNGQTPDKRADLYSLGVTLYQVVNRDLPFYQEAAAPFSQNRSSKRSDLWGIHMKKHPDFLRSLLLKLLEEDTKDRFQSARDVIQFINKSSNYHFDLETAETRESYFYSSKLVGRRREMNLLKEYHQKVFFPHEPCKTGPPQEPEGGANEKAPAPEAGDGQGGDGELDQGLAPEGAGSAPCPALVLVSGEMGSGKSRLLEEFQHYLKLQDLCCFAGNCYETNRKAYQPIIEILRQLAYSLGFDSQICVDYRDDLVKLLPEMRDPIGAPSAHPSSFPLEKEKLHFIERIAQFLLDATASVPHVILINNLHWVDEASVDLLDGLFKRISEARGRGETLKLLVVASLRPEEPAPDRLRELLEKLRESKQSRDVPIRPLKRAKIQEFLRCMLNFSDVPDGFVAKLEEKTVGNPLFIVETLKALEDDGVIRNSGDGWVIKTTHYDRIEIPHSMGDLLEKRLEKLDSRKRELLEVLSVLDKPANPKFLQKLKRFSDLPVLVELRDLEQSGIITKIFEGGKLHFQITQPKVREIVYTKIEDSKRQKYHGEVGTAFLESYRGREEEILEEVAYHYQRSDQVAKALEFAIKAGDSLKRIFANEKAYDYYMYVLEKLDKDPVHFELWAGTHEKLGDLCTTMGRYDVADRSYQALLEDEVSKQLDPPRAVRIFLSRGKVFEIQGDYDLALKCYKDARNYLAAFKRDEMVIERIQVFNRIGWIYVCMGKYEKAMAISLEALRVIEGVPERIEHAMVYSTIGSANYFKGNFQEAIEYHRKSLQIKENLENIPEITISLNNLGSAYMAACEYGEAAAHFQRALKTSEEVGDPYGRATTLHNYAKLYFAVGRTEKGWECLEESLALSKTYNMRNLNVQNYLVRGKALLDGGECSKAEGNFFRVLTAFSKGGNRWGLCLVLLHIGELHRQTGSFKEASDMIAEARRYAQELDIHNLKSLTLTAEARLKREAGAEGIAAAERLLLEALSLAEKCDHPELSYEVNFEMGETLVRLWKLKEATAYYKAAEEKLREVIENLPREFKDGYRGRVRLRFRDWRAQTSSARLQEMKGPEETAIGGKSSDPRAKSRASAEDSLRCVNNLMVALRDGGPLSEFLGKVLDGVLALLSAEAAFLLKVEGSKLSVEASRALPGKMPKEPGEKIQVRWVEKILSENRPLLLADVADDPAYGGEMESQLPGLQSLAIVPFLADSGRQEVLYVVNPQLPRGGDQESLLLLLPILNLIPLAKRQRAAAPAHA